MRRFGSIEKTTNNTIKMARAYSPGEILKMNKKAFHFQDEWFDAFGEPEQQGVWFIWGNSGNGKTSFVMQLCHELAKHGKVAYNALEEGQSKTVQDAIKRYELHELDGRMLFLCEPMHELTERLSRRKSPDFVIVDSFQYAQLTYRQYIAFKEANERKLIIFVSHADGKKPAGRAAVSVMYDAALKIWVEGYRAHSMGRYIGEVGHYDCWKEGALKYWGEKNKVINHK
jgi:molybdopterin-guanine dinucleotide biosynthesis protein